MPLAVCDAADHALADRILALSQFLAELRHSIELTVDDLAYRIVNI
jgi:hypothetical protein